MGALGSPLPIAPSAPHPSVPPRPPAAAPEEPATLPRWCAPPRQSPPGRPELPPRARGRWLSAPRAAELHRRPQQVSQAWLVGGERARRGRPGSHTLASPAGDQPRRPTEIPRRCAHLLSGEEASEEKPRAGYVCVSPFPAPLARGSLPPLRFCVGCHLHGVLGEATAGTPGALGAGSTSANVTGVGKTKALPQGALAGRPLQPGRGWGPRPFSAQAHSRPCDKHPREKGGGGNHQTAPVIRTWPLVW